VSAEDLKKKKKGAIFSLEQLLHGSYPGYGSKGKSQETDLQCLN